jgi:hypothetical protein
VEEQANGEAKQVSKQKRSLSHATTMRGEIICYIQTIEADTIYFISITSATAGFFFDMLLDFWVIAQFFHNEQLFFFWLSLVIMIFSSSVIALSCFNSPRQDHKFENAWLVALLAFLRVQLIVEMLESLSPHCVARGFGTPLYYKIKFFIGITASAPQAVLNIFILLTSVKTASNTADASPHADISFGMTVVLQLSIVSALLCLSFVAYEKDKWFLKTHSDILDKSHAHYWKYISRTIAFRTCEVCSRSISLALVAMMIPYAVFVPFLIVEVLVIAALLHIMQGRQLMKHRKASGQTKHKQVAFMIMMYAPCAVVSRSCTLPKAKRTRTRNSHSLALALTRTVYCCPCR